METHEGAKEDVHEGSSDSSSSSSIEDEGGGDAP